MALGREHTSNMAQLSPLILKYVNKPDLFQQDPCIIPWKLHKNAENLEIIKKKKLKKKGFGSVPLPESASKVAESVFFANT